MFEQRLESISQRLGGAIAVSLVAGDGIPVETLTTDDSLDVEALAVELLTQMRSISDDHREFGVGQVRQLAVTSDRYLIMIGGVTDSYFLLLVTTSRERFGQARFELRRAPLAFAEDLY